MMRRLYAAMVFAIGSILAAGCGGSDVSSPASPDPSPNQTITFPSGTSFTVIASPDVVPVSENATPQFPTGNDDDGLADVPEKFGMAETDTTYQLWKEVCDWATNAARGANVYTFANAGQNGTDGTNGYAGFDTSVSTQYPVTMVNWRDAIVWCNALTEYYNANNGSRTDLRVVYCSDAAYTTPIRESTNSKTVTNTAAGSLDCPYVNPDAKGFRLPTSMEYEFAARYIGTTAPSQKNYVLKDGVYYCTRRSASGATAESSDNVATSLVAVFYRNYTDASTYASVNGTARVKSKAANALGLYDMSGNVFKWNFDWHPSFAGSRRVERGGSYSDYYTYLFNSGNVQSYDPFSSDGSTGFRIERTN